MNKHKHSEMIKAWADGFEIEVNRKNGEGWMDCNNPLWSELFDYRIKEVDFCEEIEIRYGGIVGTGNPNIRLIFDKDTFELKKSELIK